MNADRFDESAPPPVAANDVVHALLAADEGPEWLARARRDAGPGPTPEQVLARLADRQRGRLIGDLGARPGRDDVLHVLGGQPALPQRLAETWDAGGPLWVWRRAATSWTAQRLAVGIVGTRRPTLDGVAVATRIAAELAEAGVEVVSGFAKGIDQAAHRGALDGGGLTTAVLGTGLDVDYPARCGDLRQAVVESGGLVTEYPHGRGVRLRQQFTARNRILAGLVDGVVIVEAGERSGALNTASHAAAFGREVMVVPTSPSVPSGAGALALLRDGATPVRGAADVLEAIGPAGVAPSGGGPAAGGSPTNGGIDPASSLGPAAASVAPLLSPVPSSVAALAAATGLPPRQVLVAVAKLEAAGLARRVPAGVVAA